MLRRAFSGRLWTNRDFLALWFGQGISELGSQVTVLALPTVAILALHASPLQVGILAALEFLAFPVLGLVAGVYADRWYRRPILIVCDVGRALAVGSVPLGFTLGFLSIYQLYVVATGLGVFTVFFDVAYQSYLPVLVDRPNLIEGNSKLEVTRSLAQIAGPAAAGGLIQLFKAANAMLADATSFVVSVLSLTLIRKVEPKPSPGTDEGIRGFRQELMEGVRIVLGNPILRRIAGCTATSNLGSNMAFAVILIFVYRNAGLSPGTVGLVFGVGSLGALAGALLAGTAARRLGLGPTLSLSIALGGAFFFVVPFATGPLAIPLLLIWGLGSAANPLYNINQVSLRQAITPDRVQGRMNATMRAIVWGTIPLGSFIGGLVGSSVGVVPAIVIGGAISTLAALWVATGDVARLKSIPTPEAA